MRAASALRLLSLTPERTLPLIYPRLFALGSLLSSLPRDANLAELHLPESISRLSAAKLAEDGIFLLENGYEAYVQFGARVNSELMMALLGESLSSLQRSIKSRLMAYSQKAVPNTHCLDAFYGKTSF